MKAGLTASALLGAMASAGTRDPAVTSFDHSLFDDLLRKHVVEGRVDYDAFAAPPFPAYLASLAAFDPGGLPARQQLAYWINAYNAYTIALINAHGERVSIRNIREPWKEPIVVAGGKRYHLDQVEHEIIRARFREPRIHFALVCAAVSCPPLRSEVYDGARLHEQLDDQARAFLLRTPESNRVDVASRTVHGSPIWSKWYRADFGSTDAEIGAYLARFFPPGPERELLTSGRFRLVETAYDWSLNGAVEQNRKRTPREGRNGKDRTPSRMSGRVEPGAGMTKELMAPAFSRSRTAGEADG